MSKPVRKETVTEAGMSFIETELEGAFVIEPEKKEDERGFLPAPGAGKSSWRED
jgi:hypothetical protein